MSDNSFIADAGKLYGRANAASLHWLLDRGRLGEGFLNSKQNSITLADYTPADGLRGPNYTYGWIQGRGLEALVTHAAFFADTDPDLARRLDEAGRALFGVLRRLWARDGHGYFCYDADLRPVIASGEGVTLQAAPGDIYTYSDIFFLKGLIAAAARYDAQRLPAYLAQIEHLVAAIEGKRFQMDERRLLSADSVAAEPDDIGPRMIMIGAAGLLHRIGKPEAAGFADRLVSHVLDRHFDPASRLLRNVPGGDECNVGHGIELVGFAFDYLPPDAPAALVEQLQAVLIASFNAGFTGPGIRLTVSTATREPLSPYCPWWSLPETIRAAALCYERTGDERVLDVWRKAHQAFFGTFWRDKPPLAYQTMTEDGPVDYVPATPDLDPGYHTGLSLLAAINVAQRLDAGRFLLSKTGA
ncbi:hypothetical protein [Devosia chinhatensis]|uniref:N-acylglucosamine 2-epimerase n=1 Tax=Devosia chinhatensis TaxID=429727 RepID=A0A0F5FL36_9HYPH|nr:hypothetical protein [Devosia chinhatensis]KKB09280.1 hypothetical protein VE26_04740 [Devosia chinhatensis]